MAEKLESTIDNRLKAAAVYSSFFKATDPWVASTGFRTHSLRYQTLGQYPDLRIAEAFLVNSRLTPIDRETEASIEGYYSDPGVAMLAMIGHGEENGIAEIPLPSSVELQMELGRAISHRRSCRSYTGDPMDLDHLASILRSAAGITGSAEVSLFQGGEISLQFRATPSGGGLYPIEIYIAAFNVSGLAPGIYRYHVLKDTLVKTGDGEDLIALSESFAVPDEVITVSRSNVVFLLVGRPWRSMRKYGNRGLRLLFLEAGALSEHINLASVSLGFGSVDCASIFDEDANRVLRLDGLYSLLIHTIVAGYPG